jgi:thermitase
MFASLYLIGFVVMALGLAGWFYAQERKKPVRQLKRGFWIAMAVYAIGLIWSAAPIDYKMKTIFRDLMILGASGIVFMLLFRIKKAIVLVLAIWAVAMLYIFRNELSMTFPYYDSTGISLATDGELLVEFKEGASAAGLDRVLKKFDLDASRAFFPERKYETILDDYLLIDVPDHSLKKLPRIKKALSRLKSVEWLEENELIQIDDPTENKLPEKIRRKFGVDDPGLEYLWGFEAMEMDKLYDYLRDNNIQPKKEALIAILDTGIDSKHEDIRDNYTSTQSKYDDDPRGHGTHCAGIAASVSNNGVGVASYAPNNDFVQVTSIKVLSAFGSGTQKSIIDGIIQAADNGADVISMSLGGRSNQYKQRAYEKAVKYAQDAGAIVLASAGNSNDNAKNFAPANSRGLITVSAIDSDLNKASFSNHISDVSMGIAAPGVQIYSTIPGNKYDSYNGTSMSCPYAAGLVALMKAIKPDLTTEQVYDILEKTGKDTKNTYRTGKLIFPYEAVRAVVK